MPVPGLGVIPLLVSCEGEDVGTKLLLSAANRWNSSSPELPLDLSNDAVLVIARPIVFDDAADDDTEDVALGKPLLSALNLSLPGASVASDLRSRLCFEVDFSQPS